MSYIGSTPTSQNFISGTDYFNGTGSQTAFTLTRSVNSVNDVEVVVNNVIQQPNSYTVSGSTLTFSVAPSSGTSNVYVRYLSTTTQTIAPSQGTVTTPTIADAAVTQAKLATGVAGTGPAFSAYIGTSTTTTATSGVWTKVAYDAEEWDTNNNYDTTNYRFTPTVAGYYLISAAISTSGGNASGDRQNALAIYKNGTLYRIGANSPINTQLDVAQIASLVYFNGSTDYVEIYWWQLLTASQTATGVGGPSYFQNFNGALIRAA